MTDFVISEEQLSAIEMGLKMGGITVKRNVLLTEIRSRPLSEELKKERERVLKDLCNLFRLTNNAGNFRPWNIGHIEQVIRKYREYMRSEP